MCLSTSRRDFWTASTSQRGCPTSFQTEKRSLFLALKHWGFGRCLTRWSRICNIPIRLNGEKFSPRSSWCIFDWDEVQTCLYWRCWNTKWKQNMEGNTCSMPFRAPDVVGSLMYQALAKAFDIKKAQHQRNQMLKHPGTCWWKKSQTTTFYLWNPMKKWDILHINWWSPDSFQQTFCWGDPQRGGTARGSGKVWSAEHHALWTSSDPSVLLDFVGLAAQEMMVTSGWIRKVYFSGVSLKLLHGFIYLRYWYSWRFDDSVSQTLIVWYICLHLP